MTRTQAHSPAVIARASLRYGTPVIVRKSQSTAGSSALAKDRDFVFRDAGHSVPLVDIDSFCQCWLPKVPDLSETAILNIIDEVTRSRAYAKRRWTAFLHDPADDSQHEDAVFKALVPVVSSIRKAAVACVPGLKPTTDFAARPSDPPRSTVRRNGSKPDAYFVVKDPHRYSASKKANWLDLAVTGEFKKCDDDYEIEDNIKKALWNMHHTNREDARRMCLFAFTIENRTMRLWYADQSTIAASDSFDFMDEPEHFIRFVIAFSYAPHENLGFDPTITTDWNGRPRTKPRYLVTVHSRTDPGVVKMYKTIKVLSALGAEAIRGRGTRVWTAQEWKDGDVSGEELALKDCWIDIDRDVEGEIMENVTKAATTAEAKEELAEILLKVLIDGVVRFKDGSVNMTVHGDERKRLITNNTRLYGIARQPSPDVSVGSSDDYPSPKAPGDYRDSSDATWPRAPLIVYPPKKRYRIAFAEICEPLHQIPQLDQRMWALSRASWGLGILHELGWVHRDISAGNIMVFGETVKIADFEYAKEMEQKTVPPHTVRTGTEDYMPVEVPRRKYVFRIGASQQDTDGPERQAVREFIKARKRRAPSESATLTAKREKTYLSPWFYNPLHDMESVEWIAVDTVLHHNPTCKFPRNSPFRLDYKEGVIQRWERLINASNACYGLFVERSERWSLMVCDGDLAEILSNTLHPVLQPLASKLVDMRDFLVKRYRKAEVNPATIDRRCAKGVHEFFASTLMTIADHIALLKCDARLQSLSGAANKMPQRYKDRIDGWESPSSIAISKKRARTVELTDESAAEDDGDVPPAKSSRTSLDDSPHGSPSPPSTPPPVPPTRIPRDNAVTVANGGGRQTKSVNLPTSTRTLRSHTKGTHPKEDRLRPLPVLQLPAAPRARKPRTITERKVKVTKTPKVQRATTKTRTRKGNDK